MFAVCVAVDMEPFLPHNSLVLGFILPVSIISCYERDWHGYSESTFSLCAYLFLLT